MKTSENEFGFEMFDRFAKDNINYKVFKKFRTDFSKGKGNGGDGNRRTN